LDELMSRLETFAADAVGPGAPALVSRERDRAALEQAARAIEEAIGQADHAELCAEALRRASYALERLLGRMDAESVLDHLFSAFCIGK
jgi:tRNA modification GTPase